MVDYLYYRLTYGGTLSQSAFTVALPEARGIILGLLCPRLPEDLSEEGKEAVRKAICAQVESGLDRPVAKETSSAYTAVYADTLLRMHGVPASPAAIGYLQAAGILHQWI